MDSFLETLRNIGPGRLAIMLLTFFGLIIFFIFIAMRSNTPGMTLLYGDLSISDSTEMAAKLDAAKITYRLSEDAKQVLVPQKEVGKARILLAQEGLPRQGSVGYEVFDQRQSFGTTSFVQNINQVRALEGELARTIGTIDNVRNARVHLVLPQRELFSKDSRPASASVFLNVRNSGAIGNEQIQSIQHLVSAAVPRLKASNVAIIDQNGNLLARGEDNAEDSVVRNGEDMRQKYEMRLSRSIEDMVGRIVGYGRVRTTVTADMNFDLVSRNSELFDPAGQVARTTQTTNEESIDNAGADSEAVSVENNLPGLPNADAGGASATPASKNNRTEEVTNFEISKTIESVTRASGEVEKLSIAVLVDGRYEVDAEAKPPEGEEEGWEAPRKYVPRSAEELERITNLVKAAVGYDESRGDTIRVENLQFTVEEVAEVKITDDMMLFGFQKADLLALAETMALSIVAVLVIILVLRPLAAHMVQSSARSGGGSSLAEETALLAGQPAPQQLTGPSGGGGGEQTELESMLDLGQVEGKVKASSVQKISELVTNHPNETISVIRSWMSQEN